MTQHLRPEDFVDALDGALGATGTAHLTECDQCRQELEALRGAHLHAAHVDSQDPSPLFWDHFSERVRQATAAESTSAPAWYQWAWWQGRSRPVGALIGAIGAVALVFALQPSSTTGPESQPAGDELTPIVATDTDDGSWGLVVGLAAEFDIADVKEVARPAAGTADAMLDELSAAQRAAMAQLLQKEIGAL